MTKWDKYLIGFVIIIAISGIFYVKSFTTNNGNVYLVIDVAGKEYKKISLSPDLPKERIVIDTELGHNVIEYDGNSAKIVEADCRDQLCTKMGKITQPHQINICLPNRVSIKIVSDSESDIDIISY